MSFRLWNVQVFPPQVVPVPDPEPFTYHLSPECHNATLDAWLRAEMPCLDQFEKKWEDALHAGCAYTHVNPALYKDGFRPIWSPLSESLMAVLIVAIVWTIFVSKIGIWCAWGYERWAGESEEDFLERSAACLSLTHGWGALVSRAGCAHHSPHFLLWERASQRAVNRRFTR